MLIVYRFSSENLYIQTLSCSLSNRIDKQSTYSIASKGSGLYLNLSVINGMEIIDDKERFDNQNLVINGQNVEKC